MARRGDKAEDTPEEYINPTHHTGLTGDYSNRTGLKGDYGAQLHRTEYGDQTDEYGNPIYNQSGHTDEHGVYHAGVQNIPVHRTDRQSDQHNHHADLMGNYRHHETHQHGVLDSQSLGAPGTTGAYPTTANIPYAGAEVGVGETEKRGTTGTTGAYPTKENIPYGGADIGTGGGYRRSDSPGSSSSEEDDGVGGRRRKGLKEKLKEKLPGGHKDMPPAQATSTTTPGAYHGFDQKQGITEKIKDMMPGTHH